MWIDDNGEEDTYWGYRLKDIYSELEMYYREIVSQRDKTRVSFEEWRKIL